jgi:hypothetical protein
MKYRELTEKIIGCRGHDHFRIKVGKADHSSP